MSLMDWLVDWPQLRKNPLKLEDISTETSKPKSKEKKNFNGTEYPKSVGKLQNRGVLCFFLR